MPVHWSIMHLSNSHNFAYYTNKLNFTNCSQNYIISKLYNNNYIIPYSIKIWRWKSLKNLMNGCWIIKLYPTKILHLENFGIVYFTISYIVLTWVCHIMLGHAILKYFRLITISRTLMETRIHLKEISYPIHLGHIFRSLYWHHRH